MKCMDKLPVISRLSLNPGSLNVVSVSRGEVHTCSCTASCTQSWLILSTRRCQTTGLTSLKSSTYYGWLAPFTMILGFNHRYYQRLFQNNCGASFPKAPVKLSIPGPWSESTRVLCWPWAHAHPGDKMAFLHFQGQSSPALLCWWVRTGSLSAA